MIPVQETKHPLGFLFFNGNCVVFLLVTFFFANLFSLSKSIVLSEFLCFFFSFETKVTAASEHLNSYIKEDEKEVLGTTCIL